MMSISGELRYHSPSSMVSSHVIVTSSPTPWSQSSAVPSEVGLFHLGWASGGIQGGGVGPMSARSSITAYPITPPGREHAAGVDGAVASLSMRTVSTKQLTLEIGSDRRVGAA